MRRDVSALVLRPLLFLVKSTIGEDQFGGDGDDVSLLVFLRLREIPLRYRKLEVPDAHVMAPPKPCRGSRRCVSRPEMLTIRDTETGTIDGAYRK